MKTYWETHRPGFLAIGDGGGYPTGLVIFRRITAIEIRTRLEQLGILQEVWLIIDLWDIVCGYACTPSVSDFDKYHLEAITPPLDVREANFILPPIPSCPAMQWRLTRSNDFNPGFSFPGLVADPISFHEYVRLTELGADYLKPPLPLPPLTS